MSVIARDDPVPAGRNRRFVQVLILAIGALVCAMLLSMVTGARPVGLVDLWKAIARFDPSSPEQIVIRQIRLPQTCAGLLAGGALGAAGALMQAVTRNPLADPGLLGVSAGATAGIVLPVFLIGAVDPSFTVWTALAGAFATTLLVWGLGAIGLGVTGLLVAGAAVTAFLFCLVRGLLLVSQSALDVFRHWVLGSLAGVGLAEVQALLPFFLAGLAAAALAARLLNALALGDDLARALGSSVGLTRGLSLVAIACLCAASVALAGPIGFIGLLMPHAARMASGGDMRATVLLSALFGAILLLAADVAGRLIFPGIQLEAGLTIALLGGPVMVLLIRSGRMVSL